MYRYFLLKLDFWVNYSDENVNLLMIFLFSIEWYVFIKVKIKICKKIKMIFNKLIKIYRFNLKFVLRINYLEYKWYLR